MLEKKVMTSMYERASSAADLPWHQAEPPQLLVDAVRSRPRGGRALDVGCGAGTFSVYLARSGFHVTGIDLIPKAVELAKGHARTTGVRADFIEADVLAWDAPAPFDLVLDSGCLHSLIGGSVARYRERLLGWLAPGGDFVLGHWARRHALDWRPMGPRRRTKRELVELFAPELREHAAALELMKDVPLPFGPTVLGLGLWLKRSA
jgi:SAM-dependent methyltransferase